MRIAVTILALLLVSASAMAITMKAPLNREIKGGETVFIGEIGPGQTLPVQINPVVTEGGKRGIGGNYDAAKVSGLPDKWKGEASKLYQNPLQVTIKADENAGPGDYYCNITILDEQGGEELKNITFTARIKVTWDVMGFSVTPSSRTVGPGQPARYTIEITNKGAASDAFEVSAEGVKKWEFTKPVFVPPHSSRKIIYEISADDEESYTPSISAVSMASKNINAQQNVSLTVRSDVWGDMKATNHGAVVFPIFEAPAYALGGLVAGVVEALLGLF